MVLDGRGLLWSGSTRPSERVRRGEGQFRLQSTNGIEEVGREGGKAATAVQGTYRGFDFTVNRVDQQETTCS